MKKITLLFLFILLTYIGISQTNTKYSGAYTMPNNKNIRGTAIYEYYENSENEKIYNGDFKFTGNIYSNSNKTIGDITLSGNFIDDLRNGTWTLSMGNDIESYKLNYSYENGKLDGECTYTSTIVDKKYKTIQSITASFSDNKFVDYLVTQKVNNVLIDEMSLSFDEAGFLDGECYVKYKSQYTTVADVNDYNKIPFIQDSRTYEHGICTIQTIKNLGTGNITKNYDNSDFVDEFNEAYNEEDNICTIDGKIYTLENVINSRIFLGSDEGNKFMETVFIMSYENTNNLLNNKFIHGLVEESIVIEKKITELGGPDEMLNKATLLSQKEDYSQAVKYLKFGLAAEPTNLEMQNLLGRNLLFNKQYEEALTILVLAYKTEENSSDNELKNSIAANLAHAYLLTDNYTEALKIYKENTDLTINNKIWNEAINDDFDEFEENGIVNEDIQKIKNFFKTEIQKTIYDYSQTNASSYNEIKNLLLKEIQTALKNESIIGEFNFTISYTVDTSGNTFTAIKGLDLQSLEFEEIILTSTKKFSLEPVFVNDYSVIAKAVYEIDLKLTEETVKIKKDFEETKIISGTNSNSITGLATAPIGTYTMIYQSRFINNIEFSSQKIVKFRWSGRPSNAFLSVLVPGLGDNRVNSNSNGLQRAALTYGLFGAGAIAKLYSNIQYKNYHNATTQSDMDSYYKVANNYNYAFYGLLAAGVVVWIYDIVDVANQGFKNKRISRVYKNQLGLSYLPSTNSLYFSYNYKF